MPTMVTSHAVVLVVATLACVSDLRTRRIPNVLTFGAAAAAVAYQVAVGGLDGGLTGVAGWLVGAGMLFAPYALGGMGAGDVKLAGALGAWLGPSEAMWLALFTGVAGGAMAIVLAASTGYLRQACRNIWLLIAYWRIAGVRPMDELTLETSRAPRLAYAVPILAGTVTTLWFR